MTNKSALLDEVILSVAILGAHEVMATPSELKWSPFNAPLKALGWLDMYGSISYVFEHWRVAMDLVVRRGGLDRLELYGMVSKPQIQRHEFRNSRAISMACKMFTSVLQGLDDKSRTNTNTKSGPCIVNG